VWPDNYSSYTQLFYKYFRCSSMDLIRQFTNVLIPSEQNASDCPPIRAGPWRVFISGAVSSKLISRSSDPLMWLFLTSAHVTVDDRPARASSFLLHPFIILISFVYSVIPSPSLHFSGHHTLWPQRSDKRNESQQSVNEGRSILFISVSTCSAANNFLRQTKVSVTLMNWTF